MPDLASVQAALASIKVATEIEIAKELTGR
jgi:hypothetical protein